MQHHLSIDDIVRLPIFVKRYPHVISEASLRWLIYNRKTNGLESSGAVKKINGSWYIVLPRLVAYLSGEDCAA